MTSDSDVASCDIAVLVDEEVGECDEHGRFVIERGAMEQQVIAALEHEGHRIAVVPFSRNITPTIDELRALAPRLVFNLTEWLDGERRLDAAIAGVLDMLKLRYTGASPEAMQLARDKALAKQIVSALGISVPKHALVNGRIPELDGIAFPLIVKPQFGDGSDAIEDDALVTNQRELEKRVRALRKSTDESLMCEEYVEGRDLFVALLGNEPRVMAPLELVVGRRGSCAPRFATFRVKSDPAYRRRWRVRYREAPLAEELSERIHAASRSIFHALKLRDYARIDYRLTADGELVFIEANPNPDLTPHTFGRGRCFAGVPYQELISGIVSSALSRPD